MANFYESFNKIYGFFRGMSRKKEPAKLPVVKKTDPPKKGRKKSTNSVRDRSSWTEIKSDNDTASAVLIVNSLKDSNEIKKNIIEQQSKSLTSWNQGKLNSAVFNPATLADISEGLMSGKVYELVADPNVVNGIKSGALDFVKLKSGLGFTTTVSSTESGKFAASAALKQSPQNLYKLPLIAWHVLHIVTATTELNKINKRIDKLQSSIDNMNLRSEAGVIGTFLNAERMLNEILQERSITGTFTTDMEIRLANVESDIGAIYERNKFLIDEFRNVAEDVKKNYNGVEGAEKVSKLLNEKSDQILIDMKVLVHLGNILIRIEHARLLHLIEHNVGFLEKRREMANEKINVFHEVFSNFPSIKDLKKHADECVNEMSWWQKNISSRSIVKESKNINENDIEDISVDNISKNNVFGGRYAIFNDEEGKTQTFLLQNQEIYDEESGSKSD